MRHAAHDLEQQLSEAVRREDYVRAAALRDELQALKAEDPLSSLQQQLKVSRAGEWCAAALDTTQVLLPPGSDNMQHRAGCGQQRTVPGEGSASTDLMLLLGGTRLES